MEKLIEYLEKNITIFTQAPITFLVFFFMALTIAFGTISYIYKERIEGLRQQIETLKQQIASKEDFINEYRQRLHLTDKNKTQYSTMTNQELKEQALEVITQMRTYLNQWEQQHRIADNNYQQQFLNAKSEEEKQKIWNERILNDGLFPNLNSEYSEKFQSTAILLRDEISSRLSKDKVDSLNKSYYEFPTNPIGLREVINDLERITNLLPK
jgi:hypothetical protein